MHLELTHFQTEIMFVNCTTYTHETYASVCCYLVTKLRQNLPPSICDLQNFPGIILPGPVDHNDQEWGRVMEIDEKEGERRMER